MRKTSLDLDHESTIVSLLAVGDCPDATSSSHTVPIVKVVLGCVALLAVIVALQGKAPW